MSIVILAVLCLAVATVLALTHAPLWKWAAGAAGLLTLLAQTGALSGEGHWPVFNLAAAIAGWLIAGLLAALSVLGFARTLGYRASL